MRRRAVLVGAAGGAGLLVAALAAGLSWRWIAAEWQVRRLEGARNQEEAFPILEELAKLARQEPAVGEGLAWRLGPGRQKITLLFFEYLGQVKAQDPGIALLRSFI